MTTFLSVPGTELVAQKSAVACATRSTLLKVKSSAITARQPSVPNLICDMNLDPKPQKRKAEKNIAAKERKERKKIPVFIFAFLAFFRGKLAALPISDLVFHCATGTRGSPTSATAASVSFRIFFTAAPRFRWWNSVVPLIKALAPAWAHSG